MKKTAVIIFLMICAMLTLCACQKEADMVEDMVSTVFSENTPNNNNSDVNNNQNDKNNNGAVTDQDGFIGNEDRTENNNATVSSSENAMDNVM